MKLFTKTLLFFITLIFLEAILFITLITKIISKSNYQDSKIELLEEASSIYNSHNSWKRKIWMSLILDIKNNKKINNLISINNDFSRRRLIYFLNSEYIRSGIDYILIKNEKSSYIINLTRSNIPKSEIKNLKRKRPHPFIELKELGNIFLMYGAIHISPKPAGKTTGNKSGEISQFVGFDIFLIKRIDGLYCEQLTLNRPSSVIFFTSTGEILTANKNLKGKAFKDFIRSLNLKNVYSELYNIEINKRYYNIAIQKLEPLPNNRVLFIATILSNEPYIKRIISIRNTAFFVTLFISLISIIISLFFSKNITDPIKELLRAMNSLKEGNTTGSVLDPGNQKNEISRLFKGFNEMSNKLLEDKRLLENYLNEIILLNDLNEKIFNSLHAGLIIIDRRFKIIKANHYICKTFELSEEEIINRKIDEVNLPILDEELKENINKILTGEKKQVSKIKRLGESKIFEMKLYPLSTGHDANHEISGCILVAEDISKKIEFEEKIFQAEKLSSLSLLTAGVAHEINNPLSSIMSNVQNLIDEENDENKKVSLKWIEQETRRIARIIHELSAFSSTKSSLSSNTDINSIIKQVIKIIWYGVSKDKKINISLNLGQNLPKAIIEEDELRQVVINILNNSIHAIEKRGVITVKTRYKQENKMITVERSDTGCGIPEEHLPKIFDPFFTTKDNGMGTGLGLSIVYGIINKYGGKIYINSKLNRGTTLTLDIPAISD